MSSIRTHMKRVRNRLTRNTVDLDMALALAELHRLPPSHIQAIRRAMATTKRLRTSLGRLHHKLPLATDPPPG